MTDPTLIYQEADAFLKSQGRSIENALGTATAPLALMKSSPGATSSQDTGVSKCPMGHQRDRSSGNQATQTCHDLTQNCHNLSQKCTPAGLAGRGEHCIEMPFWIQVVVVEV